MKVRAPDYTDEQLEYLTWYNLNIQAFWYAGICGMLLLFALYNGASRFCAAFFVRRFHTLHPGKENDGSSISTLACLPSALLAIYRKTTYRRNLLVKWCGFNSVAQLFVFLGYVAITLSLVFSGAYGHPDYSAHHAARLTFAHIPILVGLASKELGVIGWLTGFGPATLNALHRWMARVVYFLACWHIYGRFYTNLPLIAPFHHHYRYQAWGLFGFVFWTILVFASSRPIRRYFFKSFLFTHILCFAGSVICLSLHIPRSGPYLIAAAAIYISDRIFRLFSSIYYNLFKSIGRGLGPPVRVEVISKDSIKVHIQTAQKWKPGTHIYLHCPNLEAGGHPFSIASTFLPVSHLDGEPAPRSSTLTLAIRVHGGLTLKLYQHVMESEDTLAHNAAEAQSFSMPLFPCFTEGPYGHHLLLHRYESALFITGGTGVTFALPPMLDLVRRARNRHLGGIKPFVTTKVTFVWVIRNPSDVELIGDDLREALFYAPPGFLDVQVYYTAGGSRPSTIGSNTAHLFPLESASSIEKVEIGTATRVVLSSASSETLSRKPGLPPVLDLPRPPPVLDLQLPPPSSENTPPPASSPIPPPITGFSSATPNPAPHPPCLTPGGSAFSNTSTLTIKSTLIPTVPGRPRVRDILAEVIAKTPRSGSVAVGTCGPIALTDDVGAACSDAIDVSKVLRGEHRVNVMLHSEVFGW
ncbi:hypothetical protein JCM11641_002519 [Rhodosporidiobolus odoratus]